MQDGPDLPAALARQPASGIGPGKPVFIGTAINRHQIVTATEPGNDDSLESD
jgi:hypothetical protein